MAGLTTIYNVSRTHLNWDGAILIERAARLGKVWIVHRNGYTYGPCHEGKDLAFSAEAAVTLADSIRHRRICELQQEIQRLRELKFTITNGLDFSATHAISQLALERAKEVS